MKFYGLISLLVLPLFLASCHKYDTEQEKFERNLPGNYDWVSSVSIQNNGSSEPSETYTPDITGKKYELKIRKNNKAFLYEDGNQIKKGEIKNVTATAEGSAYYATTKYYVVTIEFGSESCEFSSLSNGQYTLTTSSWPYSGFNNHFKFISK